MAQIHVGHSERLCSEVYRSQPFLSPTRLTNCCNTICCNLLFKYLSSTNSVVVAIVDVVVIAVVVDGDDVDDHRHIMMQGRNQGGAQGAHAPPIRAKGPLFITMFFLVCLFYKIST